MKIICISSGRADWCGLGVVVAALRVAGHNVEVWSCGKPFDALDLNPCWRIRDDEYTEATDITGNLVQQIAAQLEAQPPELVVLNGDRYEALAAAVAASMESVPIAHISGGDITEGSQDDRYRDAITMLSHLHFATNEPAVDRLIRMLGHRAVARVWLTGDPGIDRICSTPVMTRTEWLTAFSLKDNEINPLVVFHPATREKEPLRGLGEMLNALACIDKPTKGVLIGSNADPGGAVISDTLKNFADWHGWLYWDNLPADQFYAMMTYCDLMVGNSSAGVHEAPLFGIPVVNIGSRQSGRVMARNVICVDPIQDDIEWGIKVALLSRRLRVESPFGDGHATERIVAAINAWANSREKC